MALLLSFSLVLVFLFSAVSGQLQDYQIVECYSSSSDCNFQTNGISVRAIDCCNRTGGGYIRHSSMRQNQCGACIVVGFDKSVIHFGPEDSGRSTTITAQILLTTPGAPSITRNFRFNIRRLPDPLPDNIGDFLSSLPGGRASSRLPHSFSVQYTSDGNDNALEQSVTVTYDIAATGVTGGIIPSGAVMVYRNASVTADDIDTIQVGFQQQVPSITEGSSFNAVIQRQVISYQASFEVTVYFRRYTGPLFVDQGALGPREDDFDFTQEKSVVFERNSDQFSKSVSFSMPRDFIVELTEFFIWKLRVNDSRVRTGRQMQILGVSNVDVFNIGFKDLDITIREGEIATLVVQQTNDHRGGRNIGGYPELQIEQVKLRDSSGSTTKPDQFGADYSLNGTVPLFKYKSNNTLADITFSPVTSFNDNFIEGNETVKLIILSERDEVIDVPNSRQTATITIIDDDSGELSIERSTYNVIENEGSVEICAVLTGGVFSIRTEIEIDIYQNTAKFESDYSGEYLQLFLPRNTSRICGRIGIINDTVREDLYENFTVQIFQVQPVISTLTVNRNPSTIRIQDDDR